MPSNKTRNTLARQWELLKQLPTRGKGKSAKQIAEALAEAGFAVSKRQVERDLIDLQEVFGLECNDENIPYGWRWNGANSVDLPGVTLAEALSLKIVEETLKPLLPASVQRALLPRFAQAKAKLAALSDQNPAAQWADKVSTVLPMLPMVAPIIDEEILETLQEALLQNEQVECSYLGLGVQPKAYRLHPLGLVTRGAVGYLVATAFEYEDVRLYALHRFTAAQRTYELINRPKSFELSKYIEEGALQFGGGKPIKFVATVSDQLAKYLNETPLSADQKIKPKDGLLELTATVLDTWQLRWWLFGQTDNLVVLKPNALRSEIIQTLKKTSQAYLCGAKV